MNEQKSLIHHLAEAYDRYRAERRTAPRQQTSSGRDGRLRWLGRQMVPNIGTLLLVAGLLWASSAGALPLRIPSAAGTSTGTIAYQGRLADSAGTPITDTVNMEFRLYDVPDGGTPLWSELWTGSNAVRVSDGLFNVMLGSLTPIPQDVITTHDSLFLGITVGTDDEMTPRVQLGSVPFAVQALTVPDGSVSTAKLADGAVTSAKIQDGQVKAADLANSSVTSAKIASGAVGSSELWSGTVTRAYATGASIQVDGNGDGCKYFSFPAGRFSQTPAIWVQRYSNGSWDDAPRAVGKYIIATDRSKDGATVCLHQDFVRDGYAETTVIAVQIGE